MNQLAFTPSQDHYLPPVPCSQAHCEQLEDEITELAAHIHAATYRLLDHGDVRARWEAKRATQMD
jgi:hypothetical protein